MYRFGLKKEGNFVSEIENIIAEIDKFRNKSFLNKEYKPVLFISQEEMNILQKFIYETSILYDDPSLKGHLDIIFRGVRLKSY